MAFPKTIVEMAFQRQRGLCAHCGKALVSDHRNRHAWGAWQAHHRAPSGGDSVRNCIVLCADCPDECHLNDGDGEQVGRLRLVRDAELPYLYVTPSSERPFPITEMGF